MNRSQDVNALIETAKNRSLDDLNRSITQINNYQKPAELVPMIDSGNGHTLLCTALLPTPTQQRMIVGAKASQELGSKQYLELWDLNTKRCLTKTDPIAGAEIYTIAALSDTIIVSGGREKNNRIRLWEIKNGATSPVIEKKPFLIQLPECGAVRICQDKLVVNCLGHNSIFIWNVADILAAIKGDALPRASNMREVYIAALLEPKVYTLPPNQICYNVLLSQDGKKLIAIGGAKGSNDVDGQIYIINEDNKIEHPIDAHQKVGYGLTLLANGNIASSLTDSASIKIWNINSGNRIRELRLPVNDDGEHNQARVLLTMTDGTLICLHNKKFITLWDSDTGHCIKTLKGPDVPSHSIKILANNDLVIVGGDLYHTPHPRLNYIWQFTKFTALEYLCNQSKNIPEVRQILFERIKSDFPQCINAFLNEINIEFAPFLLLPHHDEANVNDELLAKHRSLKIYNKVLDDYDVKAISWLVSKIPFLQELVLDNCNLSDAAVADLGQSIAGHKKLHTLVLISNRRITAESIYQLSQLLTRNYTLFEIYLPEHLAPEEMAPLLKISKRNSDLAEELIHAAKAGDNHKVQALLQQGVSIDFVDIQRNSALIEAVKNCHIGTAKLLLDAGADPDQRNNERDSARIIAQYHSQDTNSNKQAEYRSLLELITNTKCALQQYKRSIQDKPQPASAQLVAQHGLFRNNNKPSAPLLVNSNITLPRHNEVSNGLKILKK